MAKAKKNIFFVIFLGIACIVYIIFREKVGSTSPTTEKVFKAYLTSEPSNLDPAKGTDVNEGIIQSKVFDGLVMYDENMNIVGNLAESWDISADGKIYTFRLKRNIKFHNGQDFTAKDVVFSFERLLDPKVASPRSWVLEKVVGAKEKLEGKENIVKGLRIIDPYTLEIELIEPYAPFLALLSMPAAYILPSESEEKINKKDFFEKPIGTGPFRVVARQRDSFIKLEAYQNYHGIKPKVHTLEYRIIPDTLKAQLEFEAGNIDILQLHPNNIEKYINNTNYKNQIHYVPVMNVFYIGLNNQTPPFNNVKVRKALNYLIDKEAIIKNVLKTNAKVAAGSIPPGVSGYNEESKGYEYNPKIGLQLLKEAGYSEKNPLKFDLYQRSSQAALEITKIIQGDLRKHGIIVTLRPMEWSALKEAINSGEAKAFYLSWFGDYPDGENFLYPLFHSKNWGSGGNRARYYNPKVDSMLEEALKIVDINKRSEAYSVINKMIVEDAPWIYLWHSPEVYVVSKKVQKIVFTPLFCYDKGNTIQLNY